MMWRSNPSSRGAVAGGRRQKHVGTPSRDLEGGASASALQGERDIVSPLMLEQLIAEAPSDQAQTLPVGALIAWKRRIREELLEELDAAGRLLPEGALRVASPARSA